MKLISTASRSALVLAMLALPGSTGCVFAPEACAAPQSAARWVPMPSTDIRYSDYTLTFWADGRLFAVTGSGLSSYDPASNAWKALPGEVRPADLHRSYNSLLYRRHGITRDFREHPEPFVIGDKVVFLFFGEQHGGTVYDVRKNAWTPIPPLPLEGMPRRGMVVEQTPEGIVLWGGVGTDHHVVYGDGVVLDPATARWKRMSTKGAPSARAGALAAVLDGELVLWGGLEKTKTHADECYIDGACVYAMTAATYDPGTDRWSSLASENAPRERAGGVSAGTGRRMLVFGGKRIREKLLDGAVYDADTGTWQPLPAFEPEGTVPQRNFGYEFEYPTVVGVDGRHFVLHGRTWSVVYDAVDRRWRVIEGERPATVMRTTLGEGAFIGFDDSYGKQPKRQPGAPRSVITVDAAAARWQVRPLPEHPLARVSARTASHWQEGMVLLWGYDAFEVVPDGPNGCENVPHPCDPTVPERQVFGNTGAVIEL